MFVCVFNLGVLHIQFSLVITQEPKADKDEELCKKVNENLNNPPAPGSARAGGGSGAGLPGGLPAGDKALLSELPAHMYVCKHQKEQ